MEILLEPTSNKLLVGDVGDSIWIELVTLDINLGKKGAVCAGKCGGGAGKLCCDGDGRHTPNVVEPDLRTIVEVAAMADNRTMEELLQAPTEGMNSNSRENPSMTDDRIDKLADQISTLVDIVSKKVVTLATIKAVEESCVTCGGNHAYYNCDATNSNQSSVCAATGTYNQVAPQNRASNHMAPPGFAPVQNI
nr:hypothetical protein [Tanacetum cinerariifolium]